VARINNAGSQGHLFEVCKHFRVDTKVFCFTSDNGKMQFWVLLWLKKRKLREDWENGSLLESPILSQAWSQINLDPCLIPKMHHSNHTAPKFHQVVLESIVDANPL